MTPIPSRVVESTGLRLTELGLGCAQLGNLYRAVTDDEAAATVDKAWELGVRYFDTAPHYGLGLSERRLGAALAGRKRGDYVVSTKVGRRLEPLVAARTAATRRASTFLRRIVECGTSAATASCARSRQSLERLGLDRVDLVFIHDPDDHWLDAVGQGYPALEELRDQGVVRPSAPG